MTSVSRSNKRTRKKKNGKTKRKQKGKMVRVDFMKSRIIPRWPNGFLPKFTTTLKYCTNILFDPDQGLSQRHSFRANSLFDPDQTGTGHQPAYHDNLFDVYKQGVVVGSKLTVQWTPVIAGNVVPGVIVLWKDSIVGEMDNFPFSSIMEQSVIGLNHFAVLGLITGPQYNARRSLSITYSPKRDLGFDNPSNEEDLKFPSNAVCSKQYFYDILYMPADDFADPGLVHVLITIEYLCEFTDFRAEPNN